MTCIGIDASRALSTAPTGTEGYSYHLIRALLPLLAPAQVRLYFREPPPAQAFAGATLRIMPFPRLWTHVRLSWEMLCAPPQVLFVPAHVVPLVRPARTLVTIHDVGYRYFPEAHPRGQRLYLDLSTRWSARVATHVLADSEATRQALVASYGISPEKITVVYPGYDATLQQVTDDTVVAQMRVRYGLERPYLLHLGRVQPRKNLLRLLEAFAQVAKAYPDLTLVLAGPLGWLVNEILERVRALNLTERVLFPGYIAVADKAALISAARLLVFPSLYEGFGFPVLEAQACGVPVLTSNTSSLPEVAGDGALLVDPLNTAAIAEGIVRLLQDTGLREALIARGTANLARFSWTRAAQQAAAILHCLAA